MICGTKAFSLLPPADAYRLGITPYPVAQYTRDQLGQLELELVQPKQVKATRTLSEDQGLLPSSPYQEVAPSHLNQNAVLV